MAEDNAAPAQPICDAADLIERGRAVLFDVVYFGRPLRAFALRFDGRVVAYLNRCAHLPVEMDWRSGEFLDGGREFIVCSIHAASYDPGSGRCTGGPCGRRGLIALEVAEIDGQVCWYPSRDICAVAPDAASGAASLPAPESTA